MNDIVSSDEEWEESDYGKPPNTNTDSFFKPYLNAQEKDDNENEDERSQKKRKGNNNILNKAPKADNQNNEQPSKRVCKAEKFEAIKYSLRPNEEYIAIRSCECNAWEMNEDSMSHIYQDIFQKKDKGWTVTHTMDLAGKKSTKLVKYRSSGILLIMEYLVKISKKAHILELKQRHLKITVLTSYTPYPSRKICQPSVLIHDKFDAPKEVLVEDKPQKAKKQVVQPSIEVHTPSIPFPHRLRKEKEEAQQRKFLENLKQLHINLLFIEALAEMPKYAKFLKSLLTDKARLEEACIVKMNERCLAVLLNKLPSKEKDPRSFTIPCNIGHLPINNAFADLGASISLMPYMMYKKLGLGEPKPTRMRLELADRSIQYPRGIIENLLIKVDKFVLPINFVILDMTEDYRIPINFRNDPLDSFLLKGLEKSINQADLESYDFIGDESGINSDLRIDLDNKPYSVIQETTRSEEVKSKHLYSASANEIDEKKPKLKDLPHHLKYIYLHDDKSFPIIISSKLSKKEKMLLLQVLEKHRGAFAWKMSDIKGISPSFCTYKILMEDDFKPVIQPQRYLYPKVQDVVKNEIVKLLDSGLIYPISDSSWVSPIHVVPKKRGMTVVLNENNELIPSRTTTGWRVCINYQKLNDATRKILPYSNSTRGSRETFTFPYGTFAYRRMPFGLCNTPATFQRCMTALFHDMVEDFIEVFMDASWCCADHIILIEEETTKEFLMELQSIAYYGTFDEDVVDHIAKVLEMLDLIKIPNVDSHRLRMKVFPLSLADDTRQ
ncbi:DNA-directed DNA polymerase [Tanacetum coccineum]